MRPDLTRERLEPAKLPLPITWLQGICVCFVGVARTDWQGKYANGKTLSITPNWFGRFGGCALGISWGYFVRSSDLVCIRHCVESMSQENGPESSVWFLSQKGNMFLNQNRGLAERTMAILSMFKREKILKPPSWAF